MSNVHAERRGRNPSLGRELGIGFVAWSRRSWRACESDRDRAARECKGQRAIDAFCIAPPQSAGNRVANIDLFLLAHNLPSSEGEVFAMGPWIGSQSDRSLQHQFVIGPLVSGNPFDRASQLYYCLRCRWHFAVSGRHIAALDEDRALLSSAEARARLGSFDHGPCPGLHALAAAGFSRAAEVRPAASRDSGWPDRERGQGGFPAARHPGVAANGYPSIRRILARLASFGRPLIAWRARGNHPVSG